MESGQYFFDPTQLGMAHAFSQRNAAWAMQEGFSVVFIDNTNTTWKEIKPYVELALANGYDVGIIDLFDGGLTDTELSIRNVHGVPEGAIKKMRDRYQDEEHIWSMIKSLSSSQKDMP